VSAGLDIVPIMWMLKPVGQQWICLDSDSQTGALFPDIALAVSFMQDRSQQGPLALMLWPNPRQERETRNGKSSGNEA
jgi:hypothetical protein